MPFGSLLAFIALDPRRLGRDGKGSDGFPVRGVGGLGLAAEEATSSTRLRFMFSPFAPNCAGDPKARGRLSQAEGNGVEPWAADGGAFSEGHTEYFGALSMRADFEIRSGRPKPAILA